VSDGVIGIGVNVDVDVLVAAGESVGTDVNVGIAVLETNCDVAVTQATINSGDRRTSRGTCFTSCHYPPLE
jgi:hypothetical protein